MHHRNAQEGEADARERELRQRLRLGRAAGAALTQRNADRPDVGDDEDEEAEERPPVADTAHADGDKPVWISRRN
jgi:hypothetical protein